MGSIEPRKAEERKAVSIYYSDWKKLRQYAAANDTTITAVIATLTDQAINIDGITEDTAKAAPAAVTEPTPEEKKALDDKRNANRGRKAAGEVPANYKRVGFICDTEILARFEAIPYKTGKIKKELFEEALTYIIEKYSKQQVEPSESQDMTQISSLIDRLIK